MIEESYIKNLKAGNMNDFHKLYEDYSPMIYRFAFSMRNDKNFAEDVVQETFIKVYKNIESFKIDNRLENPLKSWIYKIAKNHIVTELKKFKKLNDTEMFDEYILHTNCIEDKGINLNDSEKIKKIYEEVNRLSDKKRATFNLFFVEELTADEIASIMKEGRGTILKRVQRIREELKTLFEEEI
ncbi:RNA polymerase sigma factor [bacterium]|nr:RNA polymerase sigma factor [bacterium]